MATEIFAEGGSDVSITMTPGVGGVLQVFADGDTLYDKAKRGWQVPRPPEGKGDQGADTQAAGGLVDPVSPPTLIAWRMGSDRRAGLAPSRVKPPGRCPDSAPPEDAGWAAGALAVSFSPVGVRGSRCHLPAPSTRDDSARAAIAAISRKETVRAGPPTFNNFEG